MPNLDIENTYPNKVIAGVDEAGRGPWAGPVVAAAVILPAGFELEGLDDSKKISKKKREAFFYDITNICDYGVGVINETVIDQVNILAATKLAMRSAIFDLYSKPEVVLLDGNQNIEISGMETLPVIKGDSKSMSIAAASVVAKVTRDRIMENLDAEFPQYGWNKNAGYGTKQHVNALQEYGACKYHRKSFAPIKRLLEEEKYG